jgi:hypothetical protein
MRLVNIKSRLKRNLTVNLSLKENGLVPGLTNTVINRSVAVKDKKSEHTRYQSRQVSCPPTVTFRAGKEVEGLPETVLEHPVIKRLLRRRPGIRPQLRVTKKYEAPTQPRKPVEKVVVQPAVPEAKAPSKSKTTSKRRGNRSK